MDTVTSKRASHSADVRIRLAVNGSVYSVAQLGPNFVVLRDANDHPPAEAELTMSVDGQVRRWMVALTDGINVSQRKTRIAQVTHGANGDG